MGLDAYIYDVDGFLTSRTIASGASSGIATFDYSSSGELQSVTLPNGDEITYDHDPMGRRISKSINGIVMEKYLWQDATTLLAVYDSSDNLLQRFEYADGRMPVAMTSGSQLYYFGYDQVGSLRVVMDATGTIVKRVDYDSFGSIMYDSNPIFTVHFGFAGGFHDRDMGLVRFGARDYDPATGKWTAKDPIDFGGGDLNLYGYSLSDPIGLLDFDGFQPIDTGSAEMTFTIWELADMGAGFGDSLFFDATKHIRKKMGNNIIDTQSEAYKVGGYLTFLAGAGRMVYSGAAKALPLFVKKGGDPLVRALRISQLRNELKEFSRLGLSDARLYTVGQILNKYSRDPRRIIRAAMKTNWKLDTLGLGYFLQGLVEFFGINPCP